jgi:ATP-binding cassette subfamily F protein uup
MMISYLQAVNVSRRIGDNLLFEKINLNISKDDKIALIAVNGAGKSSLLDILSGKESPDSGSVNMRRDLRISYLEQTPVLNEANTIVDELFSTGSQLTEIIRNYEKSLVSGDNALIQSMIMIMDNNKAWDYEVAVKQILSRLKLPDLNARISLLSGGQRKRVALAKVLVDDSDLLILDEPTNHLDLEMIEWLEEYLINSSKTILMVTHDRYFLDRVCNSILELSDQMLIKYDGNYEYFLEKRQERETSLKANSDKARNLLRTELEWMRRMPKARRHKAKSRIETFYEIRKKAAIRSDDKAININVDISRLGKKILEIKNISKSYDDKPVIRDFSYVFNRFEKSGLVGKNGSGKTTLLNIITGLVQPDNGSVERGETIRFGYYKQEGIAFDDEMTLIDAARKIGERVTMSDGNTLSLTQFMNYFLFPPDKQFTLIRKLSGGEKRRLYLLTVLMRNPNFLILDEPTNDLDILTLNVLEEYLADFKGCVIIVSHDRYFMDKVVDHIFEYKYDGTIKDFPGNYSMLRVKQIEEEKESKPSSGPSARKPGEKDRSNRGREPKSGLTFKEKKEMEILEREISEMESEKKQIETELNSGILNSQELYERSDRYAKIMGLLEEKEMRWLALSER